MEKLSGLAVCLFFFFQHSGSSASIFVVSSRTFGRKHLAVIKKNKKHPPAQFRCVPEQIVRSSVVVQDGGAASAAELQRYMDSAAVHKKPSSPAASRCFWTGGGNEGWRRVHGTQLELSQSVLHLQLRPWRRQQLAADVSRIVHSSHSSAETLRRTKTSSVQGQREKEACLRRSAGAVASVPGRER